MTRLQLGDEEDRAIRRAVTAWAAPGRTLPRMFPVVAIDPGKRSMGWCYVDETGTLHSGQGTPDEVVSSLDALLIVSGPPLLFAAEGPYTVSAKQLAKAHGGGVKALRELARSTGYVQGALRDHFRRTPIWEPMPSSWRSVLGLNRSKSGDITGREMTMVAVLAWVRATTRKSLLTFNGADCEDEAMAVALAYAALHLVTSIYREMRAPPPTITVRANAPVNAKLGRRGPPRLPFPEAQPAAEEPDRDGRG